MTTYSLTDDTELKTISELEAEIAGAFVKIGGALHEIRLRKLYEQKYTSFADYIIRRWARTMSWYKQLKSSAIIAKSILAEYGITLGNEAAARDVRKLLHRQVDSEITPRILKKAQMLAGEGNPVLGKHVKAVIAVTCEVLDTGGYCWVEDEQVAFNSAMVGEVAESVNRQKNYAAEGAKGKGWSAPVLFAGGLEDYSFYGMPAPETGQVIEFRWRVVEAVSDANGEQK